MKVKTKINWDVFKFISRKDEWFVEGTECKCEFDYGEPNLDDIVEDNCGLFNGLTNETFKGYTGELPREDSETCIFDEFNIYLNDEIVNNITYAELLERLK